MGERLASSVGPEDLYGVHYSSASQPEMQPIVYGRHESAIGTLIEILFHRANGGDHRRADAAPIRCFTVQRDAQRVVGIIVRPDIVIDERRAVDVRARRPAHHAGMVGQRLQRRVCGGLRQDVPALRVRP